MWRGGGQSSARLLILMLKIETYGVKTRYWKIKASLVIALINKLMSRQVLVLVQGGKNRKETSLGIGLKRVQSKYSITMLYAICYTKKPMQVLVLVSN